MTKSGKRNMELNKLYKKVLKDIDDILGEMDAGLLMSVILKLLKRMTEDGSHEMRTLSITLNDYFKATWDFAKNDFKEE